MTALAVFFWIIYAATSSEYVEYLALMPVKPHILKAMYACIAEEFCGIQFSLMINLYHFVDLIFTDIYALSLTLCTVQSSLFYWINFCGYRQLSAKTVKIGPLKDFPLSTDGSKCTSK